MGTRADFYLGRDQGMTWIGSIAWDGYPRGIPAPVREATTKETFVGAVHEMARERTDWTSPDHGWPWPWDDSNTTDYAYALADGQVWASRFGSGWVPATTPDLEELEDWPTEPAPVFPDMREGRAVTHGPRSGLISSSFPAGGQ